MRIREKEAHSSQRKAFRQKNSFYGEAMLFLVNCQNAFLEKCDSKRLRVIVEAAELLDPVWVISWATPSPSAMGREQVSDVKEEYDLAVYPEISKLNLHTISITGLDRLPREFYEEIRVAPEIMIGGCNTESWVVNLALEMWNVARVRPVLIMDGWFTIGAVGTHGKAINSLNRHFGSGIFRSWDSIKEPILRKKEEKAALLASAFSKPQG